MSMTSRVIICGKSIFLLAVEAGLTTWLGLHVMRFNPYLPDIVARIVALMPDIVIIERGNCEGALVLALLQQNLTLVELDARRNQATIFTGHPIALTDSQDLAQLIEGVSQQRSRFQNLEGRGSGGSELQSFQEVHNAS